MLSTAPIIPEKFKRFYRSGRLITDALEIMELTPTCTEDDIKKAYRRLAIQLHPDHNGNSDISNAVFQALNTASKLLSDPIQRAGYLRKRRSDFTTSTADSGFAERRRQEEVRREEARREEARREEARREEARREEARREEARREEARREEARREEARREEARREEARREFAPGSELDQRRLALKLLTHVVLGEESQAKAMIAANPGLLLITSKAVDYSGRTIIATPFQAALGAGDKPMWEMMRPYIEPEEALRQFDYWFPEGIEETSTAKLKPKYHAIAQAIMHDKDQGKSAIERFRQEITRQKEITHGKHFNLNHLVAAYKAYNDHFDALGTWENRNLFWKKVIGYVQRQMTAYDAQVHCSGIREVLDNAASFKRSLKFCNGGVFFPSGSDAGLGFEFACFSYWGLGMDAVGVAGWPRWLSPTLENYIGQKHGHLQTLENHLCLECPVTSSHRF